MNFTKQLPDNLTKNEKKLIDYIYQNIQQFPFMSIKEIADKTNISQATISRLPKHLGYQSLKEMKQNIALDISPANKITSTMTKEDTRFNYLNLQKDYLDKTIEYLDLNELKQVIEQFVKAENIYLLAKGATLCLAELLAFRLRRFKKKVVILPSSGSELFEELPMITNLDFVVIFNFLKTSVEAKIVLEYCKKIGCKTMLMTSRLIDDEQKRADFNLYVYRGKDNEYHSMTVPIALIDALVIEIAKAGGKEYTKAVEDIYELKEKYKIKIQR